MLEYFAEMFHVLAGTSVADGCGPCKSPIPALDKRVRSHIHPRGGREATNVSIDSVHGLGTHPENKKICDGHVIELGRNTSCGPKGCDRACKEQAAFSIRNIERPHTETIARTN